ncbi:MAG TPA: Hsp70 family protein [Polyangiaceae bacterium]
MLEQKPTLYAIDFGTSNSLLCGVTPHAVDAPLALDPQASDASVFRSILFFSESGHWHFGAQALSEYIADGMRGRFMRSLKRFLPMPSFEETRIGSRSVKLEELIGVFLREMRQRANAHYGVDVRRALLGRPARFSEDDERDALAEQRLREAAEFAGFEEVHFCPEPIAAAHDFQSRLTEPKLVLVADFGGGTSDFTVARLAPGDSQVDVLAVGGVSIAGDAFDGAIMRHKVSRHFGADVKYKVPFGSNVLSMPRPLMESLCSPAETCLLAQRDIMAFLRDIKSGSLGPDDKQHIDQLLCLVEDSLGFQLFESIEHAKRELSDRDAARMLFDYPGIDIDESIARAEFEGFSQPQVDAILASLDATLAASGSGAAGIDLVCCTGGTARVAALAQGIQSRFGAEKLVRLRSLHSVIQGLGKRGQALA